MSHGGDPASGAEIGIPESGLSETGELWFSGPAGRLFLTTGVLGGFTTYSTFSLDAVALYQRGEGTAAALYVLASVGLGIAGLVAGIALARAVAG